MTSVGFIRQAKDSEIVTPRKYRMTVYDRMKLRDEGLAFTATHELTTGCFINLDDGKGHQHHDIHFAKTPIAVSDFFHASPCLAIPTTEAPVLWLPLTTLHHNDRILQIYKPNHIPMRYNRATQQYEIEVSSLAGKALQLYYIFRQEEKPPFAALIPQNHELVELTLNQMATHFFQAAVANPTLPQSFLELIKLLRSPATSHQKLIAIQDYCRHFKGLTLDEHPEYGTWLTHTCAAFNPPTRWQWLRHLIEQKGSCVHRSYIFAFLVRHFLKYPVRTVSNTSHCEIEIYMNGEWERRDLDGVPIVERTIVNSFTVATPLTFLKTWFQSRLNLMMRNVIAMAGDLPTKLQQLSSLLDQMGSRILIHTTEPNHARLVYRQLKSVETGSVRESIYIDSKQELNFYLAMSQVNSRGLVKRAGPLAKLLEVTSETEDVKTGAAHRLFIYWGYFKPKEKDLYKTLLDTPPSLDGKPINRNLQIINLRVQSSYVYNS